MRGLLLNKLDYVAYSVRGVIAYQKVYMVFVSLHCYNSYNTVTFRITDIVYLLLYIVSNSTFEYLFAVLGNKNDMYFQAIFTPVAMVISAIYRIRTLILCEVTTFCVIFALEAVCVYATTVFYKTFVIR